MLTTASGRMNLFPNFAQTPGSGRFSARMISFACWSASSEESKRPAQIRSPLLRWRKTATVCASGIGAGLVLNGGLYLGANGTAMRLKRKRIGANFTR